MMVVNEVKVGHNMIAADNPSVDRAMTTSTSQVWKRNPSHASSEGERLMLEALVESSRGGRRTVLQYIKMLSVIALPVAAVICLVSYTLHNSRIERVVSSATNTL